MTTCSSSEIERLIRQLELVLQERRVELLEKRAQKAIEAALQPLVDEASNQFPNKNQKDI
jgi:hypothetical protein